MWLIREDVAQAIAQAKRAGLTFTPDQIAECFGRSRARAEGENPAMTIAGDLAEIRVHGTLTPQPDIFAWLFGGGNTTYQDLVDAFAVASTNPDIKRIVLSVDSPGGLVAGLFDTLAAIQAVEKPIKVIAAQACSAAYAIAAVAGPIEATNAAAEFGSIGVAMRMLVDDEIIDIASTDAPKKRPDPTTDEGKAAIREYLDSIHELFADAIALGRETTREEVNTKFGRGAVLLAGDAKRLGMIDKIQKPALRPVGGGRGSRSAAQGADEENMDLNTLKAKHPELYAAAVSEGRALGPVPLAPAPAAPAANNSNAPVLVPEHERKPMDLKTLKAQHPEAYEAALAEGEKKERDRVVAHLTLGEQCGDMKIATNAIKSGDGMTQTITAQYLAAGMNRSDRRARQSESESAGAVTDPAQAPPAPSTKGDQVADLVEELMGTKKKAS